MWSLIPVSEGRAAVNDCMRPERIVVGTYNEEVKEVMCELYAPFSGIATRLFSWMCDRQS